METKHTKGEWIRDKNFVYSLIQDGWDKGKPLMVNKFWLSVDGLNKYISEAEKEANARLIASAPDLLQTCMDLMDAFVHKENDKKGNKTRTDIFKNCPEFRDIAVSARQAIEKATQG